MAVGERRAPGSRCCNDRCVAKAKGPDGTVYAVTIRWLPWTPKVRVRTWRLGIESLQIFPDALEFAFFAGLFLALLLIPVVLLLLPFVVLVIELAVLVVVVGTLVVWRFISADPWLVDVRTIGTGERTTFKVVGLQRARQVRSDLVFALERGPLRSAPPGATLA